MGRACGGQRDAASDDDNNDSDQTSTHGYLISGR
jgi:hypothetical protein